MEFAQLAHLRSQLFLGLIIKRERLDLLEVLIRLIVDVVPFAQLFGNGTLLLPEIVLPLVLVDLLLDLGVEFPLQGEDIDLPFQQRSQQLQALGNAVFIEQSLLLIGGEDHISADIIHQVHRVIGEHGIGDQILGHLGRQFTVSLIQILDGTHQGVHLISGAGAQSTIGQFCDFRQEKGLEIGDLIRNGSTIQSFDHNAQLFVAGTHDLLDLRYNTHPIQIGKRRVLLLDILLSHNKNLSVVFHSMLDGTGRFFPGNIQIEDRLREHHHSAERQNRQANRQHISFGIRHKTHLHIFVESHAKAHSSA